MTKSKDIKITINDEAPSRQVGVNGRIFTLPTGSEITVDEGVTDALSGAGIAFTVSGADDGAENAVSSVLEDAPLSGGPKVNVGDFDTEAGGAEFRVGNVADDKELGDGVTAEGGSTGAVAPGAAGRSDYDHDTGGTKAATPGSRDTIATSTPAADTPPVRKAPAKRRAK